MSDHMLFALQAAGYACLDLTGKDPAAEEALLLYCDETEAADGHNRRAGCLRLLVGKPADAELVLRVFVSGSEAFEPVPPKIVSKGTPPRQGYDHDDYPLVDMFTPVPE